MQKKKNSIFSNDKLKSGFVFRELLKSYKIFILTVLAKREIFQKKMFNQSYDIIGDFDFLLEKVLNIIMELYKNRSHIIDIILIITQKKKIKLYYEELIDWMKNFEKKK